MIEVRNPFACRICSRSFQSCQHDPSLVDLGSFRACPITPSLGASVGLSVGCPPYEVVALEAALMSSDRVREVDARTDGAPTDLGCAEQRRLTLVVVVVVGSRIMSELASPKPIKISFLFSQFAFRPSLCPSVCPSVVAVSRVCVWRGVTC